MSPLKPKGMANTIDFENLTEFQKELHTFEDGEQVGSDFYQPYIKTTYSYYIPIQMKGALGMEKGKTTVTFTCKESSSMDYLMYTTRIHRLPRIEVLDEYKDTIQICWCHNMGNNVAPLAIFEADDKKIFSIDKGWADDHSQFFAANKANFREMQNRGLGNVDELEEWTNCLEEYVLSINDPWYYSEASALAYPLYYNRGATINHNFVLEDRVDNLLRVRIREPETKQWVYTSGYNPACMKGLDPNNPVLQPPELWGIYARIRKEDRDRVLLDFNPVLDANGKKTSRYTASQKERLIMYTEFVISSVDNDIRHYNEVATIHLDTINPCKGITIKALNLDAEENNNLSNYSTNTNDMENGRNPLVSFTQRYGQTVKFKDMHAVHFERIFPMRHCPSCPEDPGYNFLPIAYNFGEHLPTNGIVFRPDYKGTLEITLGNNSNKFVSGGGKSNEINGKENLLEQFAKRNALKKIEKTDGPRFRVEAHLVIIRKIVFSYDGTKQAYGIEEFI